jgi:hypothetical protein
MKDYSALDQTDTQAAFARLVGIQQPKVSEMIDRGVLAKGQTMRQWLTAYISNLRSVASGYGEDGEGRGGELTAARVREANAKAHKAEVETARDLGHLVPEVEVSRALRNWAARGALALDAAQRRICDGLRSEFGVALEDRHVAAHLRDAQRNIAAYAQDLGATAEAGGLGVDAAGNDSDGSVRGAIAVPGAGDE